MKLNVNPYNELEFRNKFINTHLYQQLKKDFDLIVFNKHFKIPTDRTPRQIWSERRFTAVPFYYLEFLIQKNPEKIYDLGCGWNIFKKYIPNIVGISPDVGENFYGDIHDCVDDVFVNGHQNYFESVFSINSLHFTPLSNIQKTVLNFYSMIKPGGVGWLSLNFERMYEQDQHNFNNYTIEKFDSYIRDKLYDLNIEYQVFDVDLSVRDEFMDGNIRLVISK
jgi:hypothetical protein